MVSVPVPDDPRSLRPLAAVPALDEFARTNDPILIVEDETISRDLLAKILRFNGYTCYTAADATEARAILAATPVALVLADVTMPGDSGLDLVTGIIDDSPHTATVLVTAIDDSKLAEIALSVGVYGYIVKPFEPTEILIGVSNALHRRRLEIEASAHRVSLERQVRERTAELEKTISDLKAARDEINSSREETIQRLSIAAEMREPSIGAHIERMSSMCELICKRTGTPALHCDVVRLGSLMHDVGKIGIPDSILLKPGSLTSEETAIMRKHAEIGHRILSGSSASVLRVAASIALTHHEWFDGSGYPQGLVEAEIPLEGRIAAIADVFEALTSDRVYRPAFSFEEAVGMVRSGRGSQFDPELLDLFLESLDAVAAITDRISLEA